MKHPGYWLETAETLYELEKKRTRNNWRTVLDIARLALFVLTVISFCRDLGALGASETTVYKFLFILFTLAFWK